MRSRWFAFAALAVAVCLQLSDSAPARTKRPPKAAPAATVLVIEGQIGPGSYRKFHRLIQQKRPKLVVLQSPGGLVGEALFIADEIRRLGMNTRVVRDGVCASACAVIFLSGRNRYADRGAQVGLHAAYDEHLHTSKSATAIVAAYLGKLGVSSRTITRMAATGPSQMSWLSASEMKALRIRPYPVG